MLRESKYRGKRKDTGEWVVGKHIVLNGRHLITVNENDNPNYSCGLLSNRQVDALHTVEVIPETVGEWTGLKDKNNNKLQDSYEDDICTYADQSGRNQTGVIKWSNGFYLEAIGGDDEGNQDMRLNDCEFKIIGTIHDAEVGK